jgi:hypothetical protein
VFFSIHTSLSFACSQSEHDESGEPPTKRRRFDPSPPSLRRQSSALDALIPNSETIERQLSCMSQSLPDDPMNIVNLREDPDIFYFKAFELCPIPMDVLNILIRATGMAREFHSVCRYFEMKRRTDDTLNQIIKLPKEEDLIDYLKNPPDFLFAHVHISFCSTNLHREALTVSTSHLYSLALRGFANNNVAGSWLDHALNLQVLDLQYSTTNVDLSPLACLPKLGTLNLSESNVDLVKMNLSHLTKLHTLILSHITTNGGKPIFIPNFTALSNLKSLDLSRCNYRDTASLADFLQLRSLNLSGFAMVLNFTFLSYLTNLEYLHLEDNYFTDDQLPIIASLTKLKELWITGKYSRDEHGGIILAPYPHTLLPHLPNLTIHYS